MRFSAAVFLLATLRCSAAVLGEGHITIATPQGAQTYSLPAISGDWFLRPDAVNHAGLVFRTAPGNPRIQFTILWGGKGAAFHIAEANSGAHEDMSFLLNRANANALPRGGDGIDVSVVHIDTSSVEATFTGTVHEDAASLKVSGGFKVHRDASWKQTASGPYIDCDPLIYDSLTFAEFRSPSACELKFDSHLREAVGRALRPLTEALTAGDWIQSRLPNLKTVDALPRKSENAPYDFSIELEYRLRPGSAQAERNQEAVTKVMSKMAEAMKSPAAAAAFRDEVAEATHDSRGAGTIGLRIGINAASIGIENFKGGHKTVSIPGATLAVEVPYAQSRGGGGIDASSEQTDIFLGAWAAAPTSAKDGDGERVTVKGLLRPGAPQLSVQNIRVEIRANPETVHKLSGLIDWSALRQLLRPADAR